MGLKSSSFVLLAALIVFSTFTSTWAVNITRALDKYPEFSTLKDLYNRTDLIGPINKRQSITVLAVDNGAMGAISGRPIEEIKNVLMSHIVLDYYDEFKLKGIKGQSTLLTTLYQTTGLGQRQDGFLNVTKRKDGTIVFGSAVRGAPLNSVYMSTVFHNPYNLSIVQVSMPIVAPGLGAPVQAPPPPPYTPPPAPAPEVEEPAEAPGPAEDEDDVAPDMAPADSPDSDAPAPGPSKGGKKKMPAADEGDEADAEAPSAASKASLSFGVALVLGLVAIFAEF